MTTATETFATLAQIEARAAEGLPREIWDYAAGGAGAEVTLERNRRALGRLALEQRILVDVREMDIGTSFLGLDLPSPVVVAPMGGLRVAHPDGDCEMARGAGATGHLAVVSGVCGRPMEEIAAAATGPLVFQLYHHGDRDWVARRLERVIGAGYRAVCLTVDSAVYGRRERDLVNGYEGRAHPGGTEPRGPDPTYPARLTWDDVEWLRERLPVPFGLKGVMSAADALRALEVGVSFIWVSNHGGRQLDDGRATIDVLPEIAATANGRAPIVVDGGFRRGSDVIKAMALGATAVAMGRTILWGLAAAGAEGVRQTLSLLDLELRVNLALTGHASIRHLGPDAVRKVDY